MSNKTSTIKNKKEDRLKRIQTSFLIAFAVLVLALTAALTSFILGQASEVIKNNSSNLIAANSTQIQSNINSYLDKIVTTSALLFSDEAYYKYDATSEDLDEYSRIQAENAILNRIVDIGIMQNFTDFCIIYSNNNTVGWMSNTSKKIFESDVRYENVASHIIGDGATSGWFFGEGDNFERVYYTKRINDNAVLLASFYTRELANVFELPEELEGMVIRLVDDGNQIIYSSDQLEIGGYLPDDIISSIGTSASRSYMDEFYIIDVNACENGWRVVCVMPLDNVLVDTKVTFRVATILSAVVATIFIAIGLLIFGRFSKPIEYILMDLEKKAEFDDLSGMRNKYSFRAKVNELLEELSVGKTVAVAIIDVDHFKNINDTLGHAYGDTVITRTGKVIRDNIGIGAFGGRIGGDEFAIWFDYQSSSVDEANQDLKEKIENMSKAFLKEFAKEHESCDISLSVGVVCQKYNNEACDEFYMKADSALYESKHNGRNRCTFFQEGVDDEAKND